MTIPLPPVVSNLEQPGTTSILTNHEVSKAWDVGKKHGIYLNLCS